MEKEKKKAYDKDYYSRNKEKIKRTRMSRYYLAKGSAPVVGKTDDMKEFGKLINKILTTMIWDTTEQSKLFSCIRYEDPALACQQIDLIMKLFKYVNLQTII